MGKIESACVLYLLLNARVAEVKNKRADHAQFYSVKMVYPSVVFIIIPMCCLRQKKRWKTGIINGMHGQQ